MLANSEVDSRRLFSKLIEDYPNQFLLVDRTNQFELEHTLVLHCFKRLLRLCFYELAQLAHLLRREDRSFFWFAFIDFAFRRFTKYHKFAVVEEVHIIFDI